MLSTEKGKYYENYLTASTKGSISARN